MITKPALHKIIKEKSYTQKREINKTTRTKERINLTRCVDKQMRSKKESNTTRTTKWQELLHTLHS
jgi:hypothetical protein